MLAMDSVKLRLERDQEMSFIEFNYMILQAYDYAVLNQRYDCRLQMGGSDQWGNIVNGIDLGRRMGTPQLHALTTPLITTANGEKMGKTASGAVWLNADMKSPYEYWQFWRNTDDADVARFLKLFTTLPLDEIERLAALQGAEINEAKKVLATEATALLHGRDAAQTASETARKTFEEGVIADSLPIVVMPEHEQKKYFEGPDGLSVIVAVQLTKLVRSNGEARRLIESGGVKINDVTVSSIMRTLTPADLTNGAIKLSLGKKRHVLLRPA
jgi:tyrosyl-tRNA synthetase